MNLFINTVNNESKLINLDLVKEFSFKKRKVLVDDEYFYFYELLLDNTPAFSISLNDFHDTLNIIKNYTDKEYCDFLNELCTLANKCFPHLSDLTHTIQKFGWSKLKDFFDQLTFDNSLISIPLLSIALKVSLTTALEKNFWSIYILIIKYNYFTL